MTDTISASNRIALGDPAQWFGASLVTGGHFDLHVSAGRWFVLSFLGSPADPRANEELGALLQAAELLRDDHMIMGVVLTSPPADIAPLAAISNNALFFLADYDGALSRAFGAQDMPRTVVLDPMLRVIADIPWDFPQGHAATIQGILRGLPSIEDSAGCAMTAPALIVPRVFSFELCDFLMQFYDEQGGQESGFQFDIDGKTTTLTDGRLKRRRDVPVQAPEVRELVRDHVVRRLLPPIERYFQFQATRMDRYIVACYDSESGGHFYRHRDNVNAGARHRRFAVTINLNTDYEGCDLIFPEFGRRRYRAPCGGAVVFSCGALHEVTPVTRGRRYAFVPFLYGEEDAALREANNANLHEGETLYHGNNDRLFPVESPPLAAESVA